MSLPLRAVETSGTLNEPNRLQLDNALPIKAPCRVRVILLFAENGDDWNEAEWLKAAALNPAFDFLKDPAEDIYTLEDGRPFHDEG
ncbi:MAG: hypothetical protein ONB44_15590 [candidate division KSB1 bacterium]|nr:hypothetical protein [candidate division KSB1 bacterium]MDZ7303554.1 hypothetical protein [candidate division KSB1 bacterium]MDZ7312797.1 hypothetical protein [candidate division KSB1 bacterium]